MCSINLECVYFHESVHARLVYINYILLTSILGQLIHEPAEDTNRISLKGICKDNSDCPLWGYCNNSRCLCKENLHDNYKIKCDDNVQLSVRRCSCVTYDNETKEITEGECIESCGGTINNYDLYFTLPYNLSELNQFMCEDKWNRTGRLCGKCLPRTCTTGLLL